MEACPMPVQLWGKAIQLRDGYNAANHKPTKKIHPLTPKKAGPIDSLVSFCCLRLSVTETMPWVSKSEFDDDVALQSRARN